MLRILLLVVCLAQFSGVSRPVAHRESENPASAPEDFLWRQRAYPFGVVPSAQYYAARDWVHRQVVDRSGPDWTLAGPTNVGGRITDVEMHPADTHTVYAASACGGVWKSTDTGNSWAPISDGLPTLAIGDLALDPSNQNTIYCGTGEANGGGGSMAYDGHGLYKGTDSGASWSAIGLEQTGSTGRIVVDPIHPNRIYVATMGHLFETNPERGLYRSIDGGQTWQHSLYINDSTGVIDVVINPQHPDTLLAAAWQRTRRPNFRDYGGPGSGIYRSTDGGGTWSRITSGFPTFPLGRIGLAIAPSNPNVVYATMALENGYFAGVYQSTDNGQNWTEVQPAVDPGYYSYGWWSAQIRVHPQQENRIYNLGVDCITQLTTDINYDDVVTQGDHADHHALFIHPADPNIMVVGSDGGVHISTDGGTTWVSPGLPITQFYSAEIDFQHPAIFSGGAQDNGTWSGTDGAIDNWTPIFGGDGFVTKVNPQNSAIYYAEYQYGYLGCSQINVTQPPGRSNWNTPYVFDPVDPSILYLGREQLYKTTNGGADWGPISSDLSNGPASSLDIVYGTITSISVSALNPAIIYAGTDDGNVWTTPDGGTHWHNVTGNLPQRWVTCVANDPFDTHTAYVCFSGYRYQDPVAHIYKTTNDGFTWSDVSGNLPDAPVNDLVPDPAIPDTWYAATDVGVLTTHDAGQTWAPFGQGIPTVPALDLVLHGPTRTLLAATYGRSMYKATLDPPAATHQASAPGGWKIGPNPVQQILYIGRDAAGSQAAVRVFDAAGRLVYSGVVREALTKFELNVATWAAGVYYVEIAGQTGAKTCRKIIKG